MPPRKRIRRTIGRTATPCPICGAGPLMLTESRDVLRPWQRLIPTVDANVVFREACTACGMRYAVEPNTTGVHPAADVNSADHMDDAARR